MENNIIIRKEEKKDFYQTELVAQRAFWNKHQPGCDEHYLVYKLRTDEAYLPEFSRVAIIDDKVMGCIMYARVTVIDRDKEHELITFGPLCVDPEYQGIGIGARLVRETAKLAADAQIPGIIIFGEPDYYPRLGFKTCDCFGITTMNGKNFPAFMGYELIEGAMSQIHGKFLEPAVYHNLPADEVDKYNEKFPYMPKLKLPGQWDKEIEEEHEND